MEWNLRIRERGERADELAGVWFVRELQSMLNAKGDSGNRIYYAGGCMSFDVDEHTSSRTRGVYATRARAPAATMTAWAMFNKQQLMPGDP